MAVVSHAKLPPAAAQVCPGLLGGSADALSGEGVLAWHLDHRLLWQVGVVLESDSGG